MWAVKRPNGVIFTVKYLRTEAAWDAVHFCEENWKQLYRQGWRCVRVTVTEVKP
jgi:hypothetical protein